MSDGVSPRSRVGELGVWSSELHAVGIADAMPVAAELEELGFGAAWLPGRGGEPAFALAGALLQATSRLVVALGILNVWTLAAAQVAQLHARLTERYPGRFLLGLGVGHAGLDRASPERHARPLTAMRQYLDELDARPEPVPPQERILAALVPRMLDLAAARSIGAYPYFVPVEHTAAARSRLGDGPLLAPEQAVTLEHDREAARRHMDVYLRLPNYTNNLLRHGITEEDLRGGSDRLADAIVAGGHDEIRARVAAHRAAGAAHVCLQVIGGRSGALPLAAWRALSAELVG